MGDLHITAPAKNLMQLALKSIVPVFGKRVLKDATYVRFHGYDICIRSTDSAVLRAAGLLNRLPERIRKKVWVHHTVLVGASIPASWSNW